ncbi:BSD domain-containing protein [Heracleum sosnowskyi]|uniref:BSD domain-containing protein n=1 Tax=Heracleum sosnowskyi TaxID=360622 RepID=A0AAD8IFT6_9APIA|nr:BSD domain-containing protein [Heracleum sosnowskyi]
MEFWQRARRFAEDAAKRSQELTIQAARRSQEEFSIGSSKLSDIVSEAMKRSKEIASDLIKVEAIKRADQMKLQIPTLDLETFGVTEELRDFVKDITINTFKDFPIQDDSEVSDIPTVSNIRQDLTIWKKVHAKLVLSTVKEISKLRYELCPRVMKEWKFWRIYFILVNSHVAPYEKRYDEDAKRRSAEKSKMTKTKSVSSAATEQDLDVFLLGDLGDSDDGQGLRFTSSVCFRVALI